MSDKVQQNETDIVEKEDIKQEDIKQEDIKHEDIKHEDNGKRFAEGTKKRVWTWVMAAAICIVGIYGALCAYVNQMDTMFLGVRAGNIAIGGMTKQEAREALGSHQAVYDQDEMLFLVLDKETDASLKVSIQTDALQVDAEKTAEQIWAETVDGGSVLGNGYHYLHSLVFGREATVFYEDDNIDAMLAEQIDGKIGTAVQESVAVIEGEELLLTKGLKGRVPDKTEIKDNIFAVLTGKIVEEDGVCFTVNVKEMDPTDLDMNAEHERLAVEKKDAYKDEQTGEFHSHVLGLSFDPQEAQRQFDVLAHGESIRLPLTLIEPEVMIQDLEGFLFKDLLGTATTNIGGSSNRFSNVRLASSFCNEVVVEPGEVFSYNGTVGRRTSQRGFLPAPAYVAGKTVSEIGGGICQVSSTLYLASLRANMEIEERTNHRYTVGYVPDGLDATVYYGALDYKFKNNQEYPVKIMVQVEGRVLTISIYGNNMDQTRVEMKRNRLSSSSYQTVYELDENIPAGTEKVDVTPYSGTVIEVFRWVYQGDELISTKKESVNAYKSRDKVILINPADAEKYGLEVPESEETEPEAVDPETGETDPEAVDPNTGETIPETTDPETGETDPEAVDPNTGETDPEAVDPNTEGTDPEATDPNTGETAVETIAPSTEEASAEAIAPTTEEADPETTDPVTSEADSEATQDTQEVDE